MLSKNENDRGSQMSAILGCISENKRFSVTVKPNIDCEVRYSDIKSSHSSLRELQRDICPVVLGHRLTGCNHLKAKFKPLFSEAVSFDLIALCALEA